MATDTETGVFQTQYAWPQEPSPAIYQQPLHLSQEGQTTLTWFSGRLYLPVIRRAKQLNKSLKFFAGYGFVERVKEQDWVG